MKSILVTIEPTGEVKIEALGFKGSACKQATAALEKALGRVAKSTPKPEMYQQNSNQQKQGL